ncbi:MAG: GNAT family N-acetyltransferase [Pirellulales bacterium]|jgi:ribosomal protein S18 acetylase RimI-like enzyme|nr:GNAT family N-acetyltransferase [Pirellulales bacterium]
MSELNIFQAELENNEHCEAIRRLLNEYALEPLEGGTGLAPEVLSGLIPGLREQSSVLVLLASLEADIVGIAVCLWGVSTFAARPALNIHDLAVSGACRGRGIGTALIAEVERRAREKGCSRVTLEVRAENGNARSLYTHCGFEGAAQEVPAGVTLFCAKYL